MQVTNNPADIVIDKEMEYLRDANERQARQFVAIIAERLGRHGVNLDTTQVAYLAGAQLRLAHYPVILYEGLKQHLIGVALNEYHHQ